MLGKNNGKFLRSHRYTIAGEIQHKAKSPEKSTPGPTAYESVKAFERSSSFKRIPAGSLPSGKIISFAEEYVNTFGDNKDNK